MSAGQGSAWGDYDNDGDLDILLTGSYQTKIYRNDSSNFVSINHNIPGINAGFEEGENGFDAEVTQFGKCFGTADFKIPLTGVVEKGNYIILGFTTENILQQVILIWKDNDVYADQIIDRIMNSIELLKLEEEDQ